MLSSVVDSTSNTFTFTGRRAPRATLLGAPVQRGLGVALKVFLGYTSWLTRCLAGRTKATARGKHRTPGWHARSKGLEPHRRAGNVVVNSLHTSTHEIGFVPKARAPRVPKKLLPPKSARI